MPFFFERRSDGPGKKLAYQVTAKRLRVSQLGIFAPWTPRNSSSSRIGIKKSWALPFEFTLNRALLVG
jgi:hypothetical protein